MKRKTTGMTDLEQKRIACWAGTVSYFVVRYFWSGYWAEMHTVNTWKERTLHLQQTFGSSIADYFAQWSFT